MVERDVISGCMICRNSINEQDMFVGLGTYQGEDILEENCFHFDCFMKWFNSKVEEKATGIINKEKEAMMGLLNGAKGMFGKLNGAKGMFGKIGELEQIGGLSELGTILGSVPQKQLDLELSDFLPTQKKDGRKAE